MRKLIGSPILLLAAVMLLGQRDGKTTYASIARQIGLGDAMVSRRLQRLVQEGYVRFEAIVDPAKMGFRLEAMIGVEASPDMVHEVADELTKLEEVNLVTITTGSFDIFFSVTLRSASEVLEFLNTKVRSIPGVRRSEVFVNLATKKRDFGVVV